MGSTCLRTADLTFLIYYYKIGGIQQMEFLLPAMSTCISVVIVSEHEKRERWAPEI